MRKSKQPIRRASRGRRYSRRDAAAYLEKSPATLATWASRGYPVLPFHKIGGECSYFEADLEEFIENGRVDAGGDI